MSIAVYKVAWTAAHVNRLISTAFATFAFACRTFMVRNASWWWQTAFAARVTQTPHSARCGIRAAIVATRIATTPYRFQYTVLARAACAQAFVHVRTRRRIACIGRKRVSVNAWIKLVPTCANYLAVHALSERTIRDMYALTLQFMFDRFVFFSSYFFYKNLKLNCLLSLCSLR